MSDLTKNALATALTELLNEKSLDKITIKELTSRCGVDRQTFYYHFSDIYELVQWIYKKGAEKAVADNKTYESWETGYKAILEATLEHKNFVLNTFDSVSREYVESDLYSRTFAVLYNIIQEKAGDSISKEDKTFISDFYKYAFVGLTLDWIKKGMVEPPEEIITKLSTLLKGDILEDIKRFQH
ncbi:MAG: TetR/AcrR family transcriptional regulator [Bacilli bacterium]|jgi:probable dihydroxyacetone kinase regulator|nr:TetR/AcrR family transcriptional regulator [Bacilli bacterium]